MTALELLESLNLLDENERIEAKRASEAGKSVLETSRAFANEPGLGGDWLLLDKDLSSNPEALSSESDGLSSNPPVLPSNPEPLANNLAEKYDEAQRSKLLGGIFGTLAAKVGVVGKRHPPHEVTDVVVALCQVRAWSAAELSTVLRRTPEVVRQSYLRPLMREGRITMTNPQEPNDPQLAYWAVEVGE